MTLSQIPWLELAICTAAAGSAIIARIRRPDQAYPWGLAFTGISFALTLLAWLAFYLCQPAESISGYSLQPRLVGRDLFELDDLSAPLVPAGRIAALSDCAGDPAKQNAAVFPVVDPGGRSHPPGDVQLSGAVGPGGASDGLHRAPLCRTGQSRKVDARLCSAHGAVRDTLDRRLGGGRYGRDSMSSDAAQLGTALLMAAILVRCGTIPAHCWVTDWFEHASLGIAILYVVPLSGVYAAVRLVLPIAPEWVLRSIGLMSLATALYAAGMATVQREARRFYTYVFLSHASLVLVGLELRTSLSLTASLCLWFSVILSLGGFGLAMRALEARFGRLSLVNYHGLYGHSPTLAICFLLTGLACVGFPATIGFISTELLVDSAVEVSPFVGIAVVAAAALNGIAIVRAYLLLFTGARHVSTVSLEIGLRERLAVLTLATLILGGGLFPQLGRQLAASGCRTNPRRAWQAVTRASPTSRSEITRRCRCFPA